MNKDLTVGSPGRSLIMFTIPLFISVMFQQMYNIADSVIAGKFAGEDALAAIGASYPITMIFMAVAVGCCKYIENSGGGLSAIMFMSSRFVRRIRASISSVFI